MRIVSKLACVTLLGLLILKTTVQAADIPLNNLPDDIKQTVGYHKRHAGQGSRKRPSLRSDRQES